MGNLPASRTITLANGDPVPSNLLNELQDVAIGARRGAFKRAFFPNQLGVGVGGFAAAWTPAANPAQPGSALTAVLKAPAGFSGLTNLFSVPYEIGETPVAFSAWVYGDGSAGVNTLQIRMGYSPDPATLPVNLGVQAFASLPIGWNPYTVTNTVQVMPDGGMLTAQLVFVAGSANVYIGEFFMSVTH